MLTGMGFLSQYYEALKSSFKDNVEVRENVPRNELAKMYLSSHLLLFPSRYEAFGRVVLETLSSGLPLAAFDIAGAPRGIVRNLVLDISLGSITSSRSLRECLKQRSLSNE